MRAPLLGIILLLSVALAVTGYLFSDATLALFSSVTSTLSSIAYYSFFYVLVPGFLLFLLFLYPPLFFIAMGSIALVAVAIHWDGILDTLITLATKVFYFIIIPVFALWFFRLKNSSRTDVEGENIATDYKRTENHDAQVARKYPIQNGDPYVIRKRNFHELSGAPAAPPEKALLNIVHEAGSVDQIRQASRLLVNFDGFNVSTNLNPVLIETAETCNYFIANDEGLGKCDVKYIIENLYLAAACDACMSKIFRDRDSLRRSISMGVERSVKDSYLKRELIPRVRQEVSKFDRPLHEFEMIDLTEINCENKDLLRQMVEWIDYGIGIKPFTYDYDLCLEFVGDNAVDSMSGTEYENFVAKKFISFGYEARVTQGSNDYGIDIIASKGGHKIAVQCKRYATPVGFASVQQAFTGKAIYDCDSAFVISNATFTPSAIKAAEQLGVHLTHHSNIEGAVRKAIDAVNV